MTVNTELVSSNLSNVQILKFKGRLITVTVLNILSNRQDLFEQQLQEIIAQAPRLFDKIPVVVDCSALVDATIDLKKLCLHMREHKLCPIAIFDTHPNLSIIAMEQGLAVLRNSVSNKKPIDQELPELPVYSTKLHTSQVRSGQQVISQNADLIVTTSVSSGAELLAQGNIHVYGTLRGRALAGITGNKDARVFCSSLDAELVSIAGIYQLRDNLHCIQEPCQIYLKEDSLVVESLC